jgi:hypothetical protein
MNPRSSVSTYYLIKNLSKIQMLFFFLSVRYTVHISSEWCLYIQERSLGLFMGFYDYVFNGLLSKPFVQNEGSGHADIK